MSTSVFKNDMEVRSFDKPKLPSPKTSPGKFGEGLRSSSKKSIESFMAIANKYFPKDTGNLK